MFLEKNQKNKKKPKKLFFFRDFFADRPNVFCECIELKKSEENDKLGMEVKGGIDQHDKGIFVSGVIEGGLAEKSGIKLGDKILQVDGHDMTLATHKQCLKRLTKPRKIIRLKVTRTGMEKSVNNPLSMPIGQNGEIQSYTMTN